MTYTQSGRIIKMTGGLYTVRLDAGVQESPLAGQTVDQSGQGAFLRDGVARILFGCMEVIARCGARKRDIQTRKRKETGQRYSRYKRPLSHLQYRRGGGRYLL